MTRDEADALLAVHPSWAHCDACGVLFTSNTAFDLHQRINYQAPRREDMVRCLAPEEVRKGADRLVFDEVKQAWKLTANDDRRSFRSDSRA